MLLYFLVIPSIENSVTNEFKNQRENVTFLCQAVGEPVPNISWYFNGVMINVSDNSSKYMIVSRSLNITTTENTLTVYNVTSSDVGTYTCNSSNIIGSVTSSGILTVTSKFDKNCILPGNYHIVFHYVATAHMFVILTCFITIITSHEVCKSYICVTASLICLKYLTLLKVFSQKQHSITM